MLASVPKLVSLKAGILAVLANQDCSCNEQLDTEEEDHAKYAGWLQRPLNGSGGEAAKRHPRFSC
jgi:hypothetical protein